MIRSVVAGEPIRLTLAALELPWEEVHFGTWNEGKEGLTNIDWTPEIKQDLDIFEFFQAPRCAAGTARTCAGSNAIASTAREIAATQTLTQGLSFTNMQAELKLTCTRCCHGIVERLLHCASAACLAISTADTQLIV